MAPSLFRYGAFVISLVCLRIIIKTPWLFRFFVMAPSLCRHEISKRRNGTYQPSYCPDGNILYELYAKLYKCFQTHRKGPKGLIEMQNLKDAHERDKGNF